MIRRTLWIILGILIIAVSYFLFWPVPIDPSGWIPPEAPPASGVYATNERLAAVELLAEGNPGPEAVAIGDDGYLYTGVDDGRILQIDVEGDSIQIFAQAVEPLGMKFDADGNLIVADATLGLLSIDADGVIETLVSSPDNDDFFYLNDLDIASDGTIYFSQASTKFGKDDYVLETMEHRPLGSLWAYEPDSGTVRRLLDGLYFANGVAVSPDDEYVLVAELTTYRIRRFWLAGELAGEADIFIDNLPGFPDNITFNGSDTYWLALGSGPASRQTVDPLLPSPFILKILTRVPVSLRPAPTLQGYILGLDLEGNVIYNLQDLAGEFFPHTASALEHDDMLYIGSFFGDAIGRIPVPRQRLP